MIFLTVVVVPLHAAMRFTIKVEKLIKRQIIPIIIIDVLYGGRKGKLKNTIAHAKVPGLFEYL